MFRESGMCVTVQVGHRFCRSCASALVRQTRECCFSLAWPGSARGPLAGVCPRLGQETQGTSQISQESPRLGGAAPPLHVHATTRVQPAKASYEPSLTLEAPWGAMRCSPRVDNC